MKKSVNTDHDFEDTSPSAEGVLPAALPESQDWRRLAALSADWYWEQGADLRFNRFESIAGGPGLGGLEQSLMGKTWSDMVNAVDGEMLLRATSTRQIEQAQRAHAVFHDVEIQCPSRDDSPCWLQVSGTPVHDVQGAFRGYCGVGRNISRRKNAERHEIARLAFYDDLTGLPNRRMLRDHLARVLEERRSNHGYVLLLLLDLDDFKNLNNVLGHEWGDKLLVQVGQRLLKCCSGKADLVARLGSDEFAVLFASSGQDISRAQDMARTLLASMGSELNHAYVVNGNEIHNPPTVCALLFNSPEVSVDELLKQVDMTLYQAKKVEGGQPLVAVMDGQTQTALQTRTALESDIRQGIARGEILLHYQPIVNAHRDMVGVEALVRWRHPVFGLVQPMQFIPLAEQAGLILQMGKMILQMACGQLAFWARSSKTSHLDVSVNVSVREFRSAAFVPQVQEILAETGARADHLKFELTESLLLTGVEDVTQKMEQLRAMGVSFVLDDFGTGYSSLAYLKRLPLSQLKIDKAFVHDICVDENDAEIARTIILLAHNLGMEVVAEGVETVEQFHFLRDNGCDKFQGFLFGHSMPPQQLQMDGPLDFLDFQDTSPNQF